MILLIQTYLLECSIGKYGLNCRETCGNCSVISYCHKGNGTCLTGCSRGYKGPLCKEGDDFYLKNSLKHLLYSVKLHTYYLNNRCFVLIRMWCALFRGMIQGAIEIVFLFE